MTPEQKKLAAQYIANEADVSTSTRLLRAAMAAIASQRKREVTLLREALLGGPLGEPYGRDYAKLPEHAQEQVDGYVEAIMENH